MIEFHKPDIGDKEIDKVKEVMKSGWLGKGTKVSIFEDMVKEYTGVKYAVALNSCTAALYWAIITLTEPEAEIIVPALTFAATANAVDCAGRKVVFADIDIDTLNMDDMEATERVRTPMTRAIIPVHFGGIPCNMDKLMKYALDYNLCIIEDCAQALGAKWKDKSVGTLGTAGCLSFHATKNITTGVGGILTTSSELIADIMRKRTEHGKDTKGKTYNIVSSGLEDYMTDINAAIGIIQMERFDEIQKRRKEIYNQYFNKFVIQNVYSDSIPPKFPNIAVPWFHNKNAKYSYHKFSIILNIDNLPFTRDEFIDIMWNIRV